MIRAIIRDLWDFIETNSYWIALYTGMAGIIFRAIGHKDAMKWVWTAVILYILILLIGDTI